MSLYKQELLDLINQSGLIKDKQKVHITGLGRRAVLKHGADPGFNITVKEERKSWYDNEQCYVKRYSFNVEILKGCCGILSASLMLDFDFGGTDNSVELYLTMLKIIDVIAEELGVAMTLYVVNREDLEQKLILKCLRKSGYLYGSKWAHNWRSRNDVRILCKYRYE